MARSKNVAPVAEVPTVDEVAPVAEVPTVEAFLLRDCGFGPAGVVVQLTESDAKAGESQGMLDLHPAAIEAAKAK